MGLRNALLSALRPEDEGLLLPQANQSIESGVFKNVVFRLSGDTPGVINAVFSHDWFSGLSAVLLTDADAARIEKVLEDNGKRAAALRRLVEAIPSEVADPALQVGPPLECDEFERDLEGCDWTAGFDSPSAFVGIFSAANSRAPETGARGVDRVHNEVFLVVKAGGGVAASTFHSRLLSALERPGATLDSVLGEGGTVGAAALRRVASAGVRNRHRILHRAAEVLGVTGVASVGDQASRNRYRGVVADIDIVVNALRPMEDVQRPTWQYTSAIDGALSKGLVSMSNAADGMLMFMSGGERKIILKTNESWGSIPFSTQRLVAERQMVDKVVAAKCVNNDAEWLCKRFAWKNREFETGQVNAMPFAFHGSHDTESFSKSFTRELGLSAYNAVRLRPEIVAVAGVASGKLRALVMAAKRGAAVGVQ